MPTHCLPETISAVQIWDLMQLEPISPASDLWGEGQHLISERKRHSSAAHRARFRKRLTQDEATKTQVSFSTGFDAHTALAALRDLWTVLVNQWAGQGHPMVPAAYLMEWESWCTASGFTTSLMCHSSIMSPEQLGPSPERAKHVTPLDKDVLPTEIPLNLLERDSGLQQDGYGL